MMFTKQLQPMLFRPFLSEDDKQVVGSVRFTKPGTGPIFIPHPLAQTDLGRLLPTEFTTRSKRCYFSRHLGSGM